MLRFVELAQPAQAVLREVLDGLRRTPKQLPAKYFYDDAGSELFERICGLPEYYLTRAELQLMERHVSDIAAFIGPGTEVIELGCGSGRKTHLLLEALRPPSFVAVDISARALEAAGARLAAEFPRTAITAVRGDYTRELELPRPPNPAIRRRAIYFPGSTVGNFDQQETAAFLAHARAMVGPGGAMVIGVDLKKSPAVLNAAYNDSQGVTAQFNLNILAHMNSMLGADFPMGAFEHVAFYDETLGRIEMHLRARRPVTVRIVGNTFHFDAGEMMRTEISCKYAVEEFEALGRSCGFEPRKLWQDDERRFAVFGMSVA